MAFLAGGNEYMNEDEKWNYIVHLDETLLLGGVIINENVAELIRNADISFVYGAYLAAIITSVAAIEGYFRSEYNNPKEGLVELIDKSELTDEDIELLHNLRKYRNKIVHSKDIWQDEDILNSYDDYYSNQEHIAKEAIRLLRIVSYSNPLV